MADSLDMEQVIEILKALPANRTFQAMAINFGTLFGALFGSSMLLERREKTKGKTFLSASVCTLPEKMVTEAWWLRYAIIWVLSFMCIIGFQWYAWFDRQHYIGVCGGLALPLLIQPWLFPGLTKEAAIPWYERYSVKATVWIAIFSFIGNWWYTHYFYSVLRASYTMPAHDINAVPIAMYFATHFYFTLYHVLAARALRGVRALYKPGVVRVAFEALLIGVMSYTTAFMESVTISGFPCYSFEDIHQAYTLGSAFYGIYFIVSYPLFASLDEPAIDTPLNRVQRHSLKSAILEALGAGMAVLLLLDFVRVYLEIPLTVDLGRPCKYDAALTLQAFRWGVLLSWSLESAR